MGWIKFEKDLLSDPRVLRMAKNIGNLWRVVEGDDEFMGNGNALPAVTLVCGALVRLWCLADTHVDEDDVLPLGLDEVDEYVGIPGFCSQMPPEWLQPLTDRSVKLPNFHAHNGTEAKKRAVTQKRVAAFRARNASALPDQTKTRPRPNKEKKPARQGSPDVVQSSEEDPVILPDWLPMEQWKAWLEVRKKAKVPNTPRALRLALGELERLRSQGYAPAAVLDQSTLRGWKSFYPLKEGLPAQEPLAPICDYCNKPSSGNVNGRRACGEHWPMAMDNVSPLKNAMDREPRRHMLGVVPKPVAGGE